MLRQNLTSKIIDEFVNEISEILKLDYIKDQKKFKMNFEQSLLTYFQISVEELNLLLQTHEVRDGILLDEKLKNHLVALFVKAGLTFSVENAMEKSKTCLEISERIQNHPSEIFEFPHKESLKIAQEVAELKEILNNNRNV